MAGLVLFFGDLDYYKTLFVCRFTHEGMVLVLLRRKKEEHGMTEGGRSPEVSPMTQNVDMILDAHTHLTGSEDPEQILECMNFCAVEKAFLFAPELDVATRHLTNENLEDIRKHNDYCASVCSAAPDRLLGFCTLNPTPNLADGDIDRAVDLMIEEAHRCYHELGLRGPGRVSSPPRCASRMLRLWGRGAVACGVMEVANALVENSGKSDESSLSKGVPG